MLTKEEKIVRRISNRVIYSKDRKIFHELVCIPEYLLYSQEEREKRCPTFSEITDKEFKKMCLMLKKDLLESIYSVSYLTGFSGIYRAMLALNLSKLYPIEKIKEKELMVKICKKFFPLNESEEVKIAKIKDFALLDKELERKKHEWKF